MLTHILIINQIVTQKVHNTLYLLCFIEILISCKKNRLCSKATGDELDRGFKHAAMTGVIIPTSHFILHTSYFLYGVPLLPPPSI